MPLIPPPALISVVALLATELKPPSVAAVELELPIPAAPAAPTVMVNVSPGVTAIVVCLT